MSFAVDSATLERLEWPRLVEFLAGCASTPRGAAACRAGATGALFEATRAGVQERLGETSEVRRLIDEGEGLPLGGIADLRPVLATFATGSTASAAAFVQVLETARASEGLRAFLAARAERMSRIADLAATLPELSGLVRAIDAVVTPDAEIRESASPELRRARRAVRQHEAEIEQRMAAQLRSAEVRPHLQDHYVTQRDGRPVLPVRADARGRVRGIVHDVSASGTTLFVEPESVVELGNRLRIAQTEVEREVERLLRELAARVCEQRDELEAMGETLCVIDLAWARGKLSARLGANAIELSDRAANAIELSDGGANATGPSARGARAPASSGVGAILLRGLAHPLLELEAKLGSGLVTNDVELPGYVRGLVISGPNAGGKTIVAKALGLAALSVRAGLHVFCHADSTMPLFDAVCADIGDEQDLRSGLSTFSARMANLGRILADAGPRSLVILDEIGEGTEPGEGAALAQAILEALVDRGACVVATTHFNRLKELAGSDQRFMNASAEFDSATLLPTYRVRVGVPGSSGASFVAGRMGLGTDVLSRARDLMDGEDRKLEALTRNLSELRQELEAERALAGRMRQETEATKRDYESRLARLQTAREEALAAMKTDLEAAFKSARGELADVMRDVQRAGAERSVADRGRAANRAHRQLREIGETVERVERTRARPPSREVRGPVSWETLAPGARLRIRGISREVVLVEGPDRKGRVVVRTGASRTTVPKSRVESVVSRGPAESPTTARPHTAYVEIERSAPPDGLSPECDLRGLRVDEALERAEAHLASVVGAGVPSVSFIHGHGSGALRGAIRAWLRDVPEVARFEAGRPEGGGNGVTIAILDR